MRQIYNQIINMIKNNISNIKDNHIQFSNPDYRPFNFDKNNFTEIKKSESKNKIVFIDGGSSEIIKSSNFSLNLIRVYYTIYQNNKRINSKKIDFYSFISTKNINNELFYDCEFIGLNNNALPDKNDLLLSSLDETIKQGTVRANISNVSNVIRKFSEIKTAINIIDNLNNSDIIVLDGSLQCTFTKEKKYFEELYMKAEEKNIIVCGLSKTTTLMTDRGNSIANALNKFDIDGKWFYHPVVDIKASNHKAEMAFVKLHEKSKYIFRFEIYKEQKQFINNVLRIISNNCNDPVFMGYPYGLIEADKNARVSNNEKNMLLTLFSAKFGKDWEKIKESLSSIDAHEILDSVG
ncbi:MAG: DNA double-strand break repair nuclease NurA [Candidatus Woesearchaeota archaeon]|nr:DNA double-strand break repair nuclease NurA [Candidatus Woesearchaeota archaeon]